MMTEGQFKRNFIDKLNKRFPGCHTFKPDAAYNQGAPDLLILYGSKWAALEFKKTAGSDHQPNQDYYIDELGYMSYAAFVYPENEEEVLHALEQAFSSPRRARISKS